MKYTPRLLEHIERGDIDPSFVISHRLPMDDVPRASQTFGDQRDACIKVVLKPDGKTVP
jgi:threonine dehydrogenase-like Zn-dependent dehydrogenase